MVVGFGKDDRDQGKVTPLFCVFKEEECGHVYLLSVHWSRELVQRMGT